ncbi:MAG: hypothetical protein Unbinned2299contig1001_31 [Prokaryotic dsDNA virus sp.]|nr:MAG: hypothetical protein Unbinned2299contig1001_31 [Prokaryotic dsDNA virus sp.]|tara:strand:+ start:23768 stop:24160 length:393 start_codon:yes stop_codon:yes gene_type:complete
MANTDNLVSFVSAEAITEYAIVSLNAAGKVVITTAATDEKVVGVAQRACASGESVEVLVSGITRVIAGDTITFSTSPILSATTGGKVQPCESGDTTFYPIARVIPNINQTSASSGDQIKVLFVGPTSLNT